ncbi:MAG: type II toxin-antitoxin system Phd/YefM family antitoxin [Pelolinea sp.]|nr:type II toxin-antitoxin system Phd/YefM family antitoxin [Pelolinea sp.]
MGTIIRPSADLRNHYSEISKLVRESRNTVVITVNGRGDTAVIGLQEYNQMTAELELLRSLAEADDDVNNGRIAPIQNSFDDLRATLLKRKNG